MAIEWDLYLGGTSASDKLPSFGRKVTINKKETVREQRAADGTLKQDILYVKREFILTYKNITETDLGVLDTKYDGYVTNKAALTLYMYTSAVAHTDYTVIPKPVDRTRVVKGADNLYSGVKFVMIEV